MAAKPADELSWFGLSPLGWVAPFPALKLRLFKACYEECLVNSLLKGDWRILFLNGADPGFCATNPRWLANI